MVIVPKYSKKELDSPQCSLLDIALFPIFQTREDYEKYTGNLCPPYDPNKDMKYWYDPDPNPEYDEGYWVVYPFSSDIEVKEGKIGKIKRVVVKKADVGTVNIGTGRTNEPGTGNVIPVPIRKLTENEELVVGSFSTVFVINKDLYKITAPITLSDIMKELQEIKKILTRGPLLSEEEILREVKERR